MDARRFVSSTTTTERRRTKKNMIKTKIPQDPTRWQDGNGEGVTPVEWKGHAEDGDALHSTTEQGMDEQWFDGESMETSKMSNSNGKKNDLTWIHSYDACQQMLSEELESLCMDAIRKHKLANHEYSDWAPTQEASEESDTTTTTTKSDSESNCEEPFLLPELQSRLEVAEKERKSAQAMEQKWRLQSLAYESRCKELERQNDALEAQMADQLPNLSDGRNVEEMRDIIKELVIELEQVEQTNRQLRMERDEALEREAALLQRESRLVERESRLMEILTGDATEKQTVTPHSESSPLPPAQAKLGDSMSGEKVLTKKNQHDKATTAGNGQHSATTNGEVRSSQMALSLELILALTNMTESEGDGGAEDHVCDLLVLLGDSLSRGKVEETPQDTIDNGQPKVDCQTVVWSPGVTTTANTTKGRNNGASRGTFRRRRRPRNCSKALTILPAPPIQNGLQRAFSEPLTAIEKDDVARWMEDFKKILQRGDNLADGVMTEVRNLGEGSANGRTYNATFVPVTKDSSCALTKRKRELDVEETDKKYMALSTTSPEEGGRFDEMMSNMLELLQKTKEADALTMEAGVATVRREAADEIHRLKTQHQEELAVICTQYVQLKVLCRWQRFVHRRRVTREATTSNGVHWPSSEFSDCQEEQLD